MDYENLYVSRWHSASSEWGQNLRAEGAQPFQGGRQGHGRGDSRLGRSGHPQAEDILTFLWATSKILYQEINVCMCCNTGPRQSQAEQLSKSRKIVHPMTVQTHFSG